MNSVSPHNSSHALQQRPAGLFKTLTCLSLCALTAVPLDAVEISAKSLADLSIEELMNESVTSVSKKEQRLADVASAVSLLSNEDIRRSGATSIAEALRMVPGLDVASVNAREWAISARGFNNLYANKLLMLVDGRSVYTPLFSGVYWDLQQTLLEDVDRIEVIRGPGATVWGANAVNGVISVSSRSARDTQGGLLYFSGGGVERAAPGVRYGGRAGDSTYYRVFASHLSRDDYPLANGQPALDGWKGWHGGLRVDSYMNVDTQLTWQASASGVRVDSQTSDSMNLNTLGRWTRRLSARSTVQAQLYFDRDRHDESARANTLVSTTDFSLHHTFGGGERNDFIWGVGYRHIDNRLDETNPFARVLDQDFNLQLFSAFVQDEITIVPRTLSVTLGTKIEHNDFTGFELQPSIRTVVKPTDNQSVWAAISRAVRTPNVIEGMNAVAAAYGAPFPGPGGGLYIPTVVGNPDLESDVLWAYETGYRARLSKRVSIDLALFQNNYRSMISVGAVRRLIPSAPLGIAEISWGNHTTGHTNGGEITLNVSPTASWRLAASYALLNTQFSSDVAATSGSEGNSPRNQATLRSFYDLSARMNVDTQLRYVGHINAVPGYIGADVRWSYRLADHIEISIIGKNLLDRRHPEQAPTAFASVAEVPRSVTGKVTWRF